MGSKNAKVCRRNSTVYAKRVERIESPQRCEVREVIRQRATNCTSSAAGLSDSPWTTGSKQNQKFPERRSPAPNRNSLRDGDNLNAGSDQTHEFGDLGHSRWEHRGPAPCRCVAPIPLGCHPDWASSGGVRRAGCKSEQMPAVRLGPAVHH